MAIRFHINIKPNSSPGMEFIRLLRTIAGVSLSAAKDLAERGGTVKVTTDRNEADAIKGQLESAGAQVEIVEEGTGGRSERRFRVQLITAGEDRSAVVEVVSRLTGMDADAAQGVVDQLGVVAEGLGREAAERMVGELALVGAQAQLLPIGPFSLESGKALRVRVIDEQDQGVAGVAVRLKTDNPSFNDAVSVPITNAEGAAAFDDLSDEVNEAFDELPAVRFSVEGPEQKYRVVHNGFVWVEYEEFPEATFTLIVRKATQPEPEPVEPEPEPEPVEPEPEEPMPDKDAFSVHGTVHRPAGEVAVGLTVRAFDRDLRSQELLGEATTDEEGQYEIAYTREQFRRAEKERADLVLRVYNAVGTELEVETSRGGATIFNAQPEEEVNLQIQTSASGLIHPSEYEREVQALTPTLDGVPLADLTEEDVLFLHHEVEVERDHIRFIAQDARLAQKTSLPEAVFYGLARLGVGIAEEERNKRIDLPTLLAVPIEDLMDTVKRTAGIKEEEAGGTEEDGELIIPRALEEVLDDIRARFEQLKAEREAREREEWTQNELVGRLLKEQEDGADEEPLTGYRIQGTWRAEEHEPEPLVVDETDVQGSFTLAYAVPPEMPEGTPLTFELVVLRDGEEVARREVERTSAEVEPLELRLHVPELPPLGAEVEIEALPLETSSELQEALAAQGIHNLADIRVRGGFERMARDEESPFPEELLEQEEVQKLQAFTDLSPLYAHLAPEEQIDRLAGLVGSGYYSLPEILAQPREQFVEDVSDVMEPGEAERTYFIGEMQRRAYDHAYVDRYTSGDGAATASDEEPTFTFDPELDPGFKCACDECTSALSPNAYLADLLGYVLKHVRKAEDGGEITTELLRNTFHHRFDELPLSCAASKRRVRQVRIAVEVLLDYLASDVRVHLPGDLPAFTRSAQAKAYRFAAYDALLEQVGTSRTELKEALGDEEIREVLASRIGVPVDFVEALVLDPEAPLEEEDALSEQNLETLFGLPATVEVQPDGTVALTDPFADLTSTPDPSRLLQARLEYLRHLWREQDFPADAYADDTLPFIDPDLIGPDDFRTPDPATPAFSLWVKRRGWADAQLQELHTARTNAPDSQQALQAILGVLTQPVSYQRGSQTVEQTPWASQVTVQDLLTRKQKLEKGEELEATNAWIDDHHLTLDSFSRLGEVAGQLQRGEDPSEEDWGEVASILAQVQKQVFFQTWREEEQSDGISTFSLGHFQFSRTEPGEGKWSQRLEEARPLVDPQLLDRADLPDADLGAAVLYSKRNTEIEDTRQKIASAFDTAGLEEALKAALGDPSSVGASTWMEHVDALAADLRNIDATVREQAVQKIEDVLRLTEKAFQHLVSVKAQVEDPGQDPKPEDLDRLFDTLTTAHKLKTLYADWASEEAGGPLPYWKALKARLPRWRARQADRQVWRHALEQRNRPPILDPVLVRSDDLADLVPGATAFDLWRSRRRELDQALQQLSNELTGTRDDKNALLKTWLGISLDQLLELDEREQAGQDLSAWLRQFLLTREAYRYLVDWARKVNAGNDTDEEGLEVGFILIGVWRRQQHAAWRQEEAEKGITLTPEHFRATASSLSGEATLTPFLLSLDSPARLQTSVARWWAGPTARRDWVRTLRARLDQQAGVEEALREAVSTAEERTLPGLRDALVETVFVPENRPLSRAAWLTDRFLIDMQTSGCQTTTRVTQAIEVLQQLVFSIRTGQFERSGGIGFGASGGVDLKLSRSFSEKEWRWIGSYETWKAATSVFLYPEQVLLPTLRKEQTPLFDLLAERHQSVEMTLEMACQDAQAYSEYIQDLLSLMVEATCWGWTTFSVSGECAHTATETRNIFYMFARGGVTNRIYWSTYDPGAPYERAQSYWRVLDIDGDLSQVQLLGVTPHSDYRADTHHLLLFLKRRSNDGRSQELAYAKFDLPKREWLRGETEGKELDNHNQAAVQVKQMEFGEHWFEAAVVTRSNPSSPPALILRSDSSQWYILELKRDGSWTKRGIAVNKRRVLDRLYPASLLAAVEVGINEDERFMVFVHQPSPGDANKGVINAITVNLNAGTSNEADATDDEPKAEAVASTWVASDVEKSGWLGAFQNKHQAYALWKGVDGTAWHRVVAARSDTLLGLSRTRLFIQPSRKGSENEEGELSFARYGGGSVVSGADFQVIYQYTRGKGSVRGAVKLRRVVREHVLFSGRSIYASKEEVDVTLINPRWLSVPPGITRRSGMPEQAASRRDVIERLYSVDTLSGGPSNLNHRVYLDEAYFFLPLQIALRLRRAGSYEEALDWLRSLYDYLLPTPERRQEYILNREASFSGRALGRAETWLEDPLNPHAVAEQRTESYLRFTLVTIVGCLLDYADAEFTRDTSESVARARTLYTTALELLNTEVLRTRPDPCQTLIDGLSFDVEDPELRLVWERVRSTLREVTHFGTLKNALALLEEALERTGATMEIRLADAVEIAKAAISDQAKDALQRIGNENFLNSIAIRGHRTLSARPALANTLAAVGDVASYYYNAQDETTITVNGASNGEEVELVVDAEIEGRRPFDEVLSEYVPNLSYFCIPPNPTAEFLRLRTEAALFKIRHCMNIAGLRRELEPYSAPTAAEALPSVSSNGRLRLGGGGIRVQPTLYRYRVLVERAKQLVSLAQQMEAAFLSSLEKRDQEAYSLLRARHEAELARASVRLQELRVDEAEGGVELAELQRERAHTSHNYYSRLVQGGLLDLEKGQLQLLGQVLDLYEDISELSAINKWVAPFSLSVSGGGPSLGISPGAWISAEIGRLSADASARSTEASMLATRASYERRRQEWTHQREMAMIDVDVGKQQVELANSRVQITEQEQRIAEIRSEQAGEAIEFLNNKFTNRELYEWMSGVLEDIYRYFLQQATAMAKLAENQLAFERQEPPALLIRSDYWIPPQEGALLSTNGEERPDRRGLTGSARLLQDVYRLDQYAFETARRKHQLAKTVSLARHDPFAFQRFRETGVLIFDTPQSLFERDFPHHYLRLIRRVSTSVVALIPPTDGIKATLTSAGVSRVVIGGDTFQTTLIRRPPERVALTSPVNATGVFELNPEPEMLYPFEGNGVDTRWELSLPKAANAFDFRTIADVLFTVEYTALHSEDYGQQVIQRVDRTVSADRAFSFRQEFSDAWYDLHNPELTDRPMTVTFETRREDFPPNLSDLRIGHVVLYFAAADGESPELKADLQFMGRGTDVSVGGEATSVDGVVSTRRGNAGSWFAMLGKAPQGQWQLSLPNTPEVRRLFKNEEIDDILFVITYEGQTPAWPTS